MKKFVELLFELADLIETLLFDSSTLAPLGRIGVGVLELELRESSLKKTDPEELLRSKRCLALSHSL